MGPPGPEAGARARAGDPAKTGAPMDPGFRVCDVRVGEWARPERDEERDWRDHLLVRAEQVAIIDSASSASSTATSAIRSTGTRDHGSGRKAPLRFAPLIDYRDSRVTGEPNTFSKTNATSRLAFVEEVDRAELEPDYLSSAKAFFASSFPWKLAGEFTAAIKAARAPSLSPVFRDASPRWY